MAEQQTPVTSAEPEMDHPSQGGQLAQEGRFAEFKKKLRDFSRGLALDSLARIIILPLAIYLLFSLFQAIFQQLSTPRTQAVSACVSDSSGGAMTFRLMYPARLFRNAAPQPVVVDALLHAGVPCDFADPHSFTSTVPLMGSMLALTSTTSVLFVDQDGKPISQSISLAVDTVQETTTSIWVRHTGLDEAQFFGSTGYIYLSTSNGTILLKPWPIWLESCWGQFGRSLMTIILGPGGLFVVLAALIAQWSAEQEKKRHERQNKEEEKKQLEEEKRLEEEKKLAKEKKQEDERKQQEKEKKEKQQGIERLRKELGSASIPTLMAQGLIAKWAEWITGAEAQQQVVDTNDELAKRLVADFDRAPGEWVQDGPRRIRNVTALAALNFSDTDIQHQLDDLCKVLQWWEGANKPDSDWVPSSPFMAGFYHNLAWRPESEFHWDTEGKSAAQFLRGVFACDQLPQHDHKSLLQAGSTTLADVLADHTFHEKLPTTWGTPLKATIQQFADRKQMDPITDWCSELVATWKRQERNEQTQTGKPPVRLLWPLEQSKGHAVTGDANYDFRVDDNEAGHSPFQVDRVKALTSVINPPQVSDHYLIVGEHGAGKTALRLYLEYQCQTDGVTLPVFFMAPRELACNHTLMRQLQCLAACIGNELFAHFCETDGQLLHAANRSLSEAELDVVAVYWKRYGYAMPASHDSLFWPTPAPEQTDIDKRYSQRYVNGFYRHMRDRINNLPESVTQFISLTPAHILSDVAQVVCATGFGRVLLLIDNMDDALRYVSAEAFAEVLGELFAAGKTLKQYGIMMCAFIPTAVYRELCNRIAIAPVSASSADKRLSLYRVR